MLENKKSPLSSSTNEFEKMLVFLGTRQSWIQYTIYQNNFVKDLELNISRAKLFIFYVVSLYLIFIGNWKFI